MEAIFFKIKTYRRRHMMDLMAQRPGFHLHPIFDIGYAVDDVGVRPGHVDHHGRVDLFTVSQCYASNFAPIPANLHHFAVEQELATIIFGRPLHVVGGQLRVVDVA